MAEGCDPIGGDPDPPAGRSPWGDRPHVHFNIESCEPPTVDVQADTCVEDPAETDFPEELRTRSKDKSWGIGQRQVSTASVQSNLSTASHWTLATADGEELAPEAGRPCIREDWDGEPSAGNLTELYKVRSQLGQGCFATVYICKEITSGEKRAVKTVKVKELAKDWMRVQLEQEIRIVGKFQHPYLVFVYEVFREAEHVHIVQELGRGGNLFDKVFDHPRDPDQQPRKGLPLDFCARYMYQMLEGLRFLHAHRVAHRDVKPENYMLKRRNNRAPIMLIDFGFACGFPEDGERLSLRVGSPAYMAPEIMEGSYDEKCDVYSVGACSFFLFAGDMPYPGGDESEIMANAKAGNLQMKDDDWHGVPEDAKKIVAQMLTRDPANRPSAQDLLGKKKSWVVKHGYDPSHFLGPERKCCVVC